MPNIRDICPSRPSTVDQLVIRCFEAQEVGGVHLGQSIVYISCPMHVVQTESQGSEVLVMREFTILEMSCISRQCGVGCLATDTCIIVIISRKDQLLRETIIIMTRSVE